MDLCTLHHSFFYKNRSLDPWSFLFLCGVLCCIADHVELPSIERLGISNPRYLVDGMVSRKQDTKDVLRDPVPIYKDRSLHEPYEDETPEEYHARISEYLMQLERDMGHLDQDETLPVMDWLQTVSRQASSMLSLFKLRKRERDCEVGLGGTVGECGWVGGGAPRGCAPHFQMLLS